jgi:hypothetical protein
MVLSRCHPPVGILKSDHCRVAISIRSRQAACPWFLWRLAATAAVDVLAVLVVNRAAQPSKLMQPSEAVLGQVRAPLLLVCHTHSYGCCNCNAYHTL